MWNTGLATTQLRKHEQLAPTTLRVEPKLQSAFRVSPLGTFGLPHLFSHNDLTNHLAINLLLFEPHLFSELTVFHSSFPLHMLLLHLFPSYLTNCCRA